MSHSPQLATAIGVVGAARVGLALAHQIARNGHDVILFTTLDGRMRELQETRRAKSILPELKKLHPRVHITMDPEAIASRCTLIFVTISEHLLTQVLGLLGPFLDGAHQIVHGTHSLYGETLTRSSQLIEETTPVKQLGVLAGPIHTTELIAEKPIIGVVGSEFPDVITATKKVLDCQHVQLHASNDVPGIEYAAALHQIVTLTIGMVDGLGLSSGVHAGLVAAGLYEISRIGTLHGAQRHSFYGLSGVGRIVDSLKRGGANYRLGLELAQSKNIAETLANAPVESKGPEIVRALLQWSRSRGVELPFTEMIAKILDDDADIETTLRRLMQQDELFSYMGPVTA